MTFDPNYTYDADDADMSDEAKTAQADDWGDEDLGDWNDNIAYGL